MNISPKGDETASFDVYVYGMTVLSTIHRLKGPYPPADTYQEITQTNVMPGGEGGNAAILLSHWGLKSRLDGVAFGSKTEATLREFMARYDVDVSLIPTVEDFEGWRDVVLCDGETRTVFGWFQQHFASERALWTEPDEASIKAAKCVALDPFFGETSQKVAELCVKHGTDYVTLDARYDDPLAQNARAIAVSREYINSTYPDIDPLDLLNKYRETCKGLVVFTFGSETILYAAPDMAESTSMHPYPIKVQDTLAAGDTFRAGLVYGVVKGMNAEDTVRFATASAAVCCTRFPSILVPPGLDEIDQLITSQEI